MKQKIKIILLFIMIMIFSQFKACYAYDYVMLDKLEEREYSEEFKKWLNTPVEERKTEIVPDFYEYDDQHLDYTQLVLKNSFNPIKDVRALKDVRDMSYFSLFDVFQNPSNKRIKDQLDQGTCWTFATCEAVESSLVYKGIKKFNQESIFNLSERHVLYGASRDLFTDGINKYGFIDLARDGGNYWMATAYLTNGMGAIDEEDMPYENNSDKISIQELNNKTTKTKVKKVRRIIPTDSLEDVIIQMKTFLYEYGALASTTCHYGIDEENGATYFAFFNSIYMDHGITIIGWDDNYEIDNFHYNKPSIKGAWIAKNSWGEDSGDHGLLHVSYLDLYTYLQVMGIEDVVYYEDDDERENDTIYQNDKLGVSKIISLTDMEKQKDVFLANVFERDKSKTESLKSISVYTVENANVEVYINPNNSSKKLSDLQKVELKDGSGSKEKVNVNSGYTELEFKTPIHLSGDDFVVAIKSDMDNILLEGPMYEDGVLKQNTPWDGMEINAGESFISDETLINSNSWDDLYTYPGPRQGNACIKAFSKNVELVNLSIAQLPRTKYGLGENDSLDLTSGKLLLTYSDGSTYTVNMTSDEVTATGFDNSEEGTKTITVSCSGLSVDFEITVEDNYVPGPVLSNINDLAAEISDIDFNEDDYSVEKIKIEMVGIKDVDSLSSQVYKYRLFAEDAKTSLSGWLDVKKVTPKDNGTNEIEIEIDKNTRSKLALVEENEKLYIKLKEIATRNEQELSQESDTIQVGFSNSVKQKIADVIEKILSDPGKDDTLADKPIPDAGIKIGFIIAIITVVGLSIFFRYRYKNIDK